MTKKIYVCVAEREDHAAEKLRARKLNLRRHLIYVNFNFLTDDLYAGEVEIVLKST